MFQTLRRGRSLHRPGTMRQFYGNLRRIRTALGSMWASNLRKLGGISEIPHGVKPAHGYYTHVYDKCHAKMPDAHVKKRCLRARRCFRLRKNRAPAGSQSAGARFFLWQDSRRGSVSGLNCRRKERHLLQSPPSPIKTANTNKKSAQPNPTAARIHSLILERNTRSTPVPAQVRDSAQQT